MYEVTSTVELSTRQVSVWYGSTVALDDVSVTFPLGSRTVICGIAGSGKTTLLKVLAGLIAPTGGDVSWNTRSLKLFSRDEKRSAQIAFGMVFQSDALFDSMTVRQNVELPLIKRRVPKDEARARAEAALERVGLTRAADQNPETLSGGMKKRVGVARAIVARPDVLLADDPFAGLDPRTEASIAALLLEVSEGRSLIVGLPDPVESLPIDRVLTLRAGKLA